MGHIVQFFLFLNIVLFVLFELLYHLLISTLSVYLLKRRLQDNILIWILDIDYHRRRGKQRLYYVLRGKQNVIDIYTPCLMKFDVLIFMKTLLLLLIIVVYLKKKKLKK